jgi:hypothetical protein
MLREKCLRCGSSDLYHGRVMGQSGISLWSARSLFRAVSATQCLACLTCGSLEPYLDDKGTAKLRDWKASESNMAPLPPGSDAQRQSTMIALMVVLAIIGVAVAVLIPTLEVAQKLK